MSLRTALDRIIVLQEALTITDPVNLTVKKAYKFVPPASVQVPDLPCCFNSVSLVSIEGNASMRTRRFQVLMQCPVARMTVEDDISMDIATALFEQAVDDFGHDIALQSMVTLVTMRGAEPTVGRMEWGQAYIGWQAYLDLQITDAFPWS